MYFSTGAQLQAAIDALPASKKGSFTPFDAFFYGNTYMAAYSGTLSPLEHFVQIGAARGYAPSAQFDPTYYASAYADLRGRGLDSADLLYHFLQYGLDEGRAPNAELAASFNATQYLTNNPDVAEYINAHLDEFGGSASNGALAHFVKFGQFEGRNDSGTDVNAATQYLSAGQDVLTGTNGNDLFIADVVQNANGQQVNSLGSGDRIDGGAGVDTLNAEVTAGSFVGGSLSMPIQPKTNSVENINLQAVIADLNPHSRAGNNDQVYVNAKDMVGVQKIASVHSDADLTIMNLTSRGNSHVSEMTVGMEYTGNRDSHWDASDLHVYFDQDYLTRERLLSRPSVDIRVMNEDAYDETDGALPLDGVFFRQLTFTLNGETFDLKSYLSEDPNGTGGEIRTYAEALAAIQAALAELKADNADNAALQSVQADLGPAFHADRNPDTLLLREGTSIRLSVDGITNGADNTLIIKATDLELARAATATVENNNRYERADNTPPVEDSNLSINVDLEKVGLTGDGGELVIGSMNKSLSNTWGARDTHTDTVSGIQEFDVTVHGTNDKSSSLAGLHSTNNNLRTVVIDSEGGKEGNWADLNIGNSNTSGGSLGTLGGNAGALKDVQTFDASAFKGDLDVYAALTREITAKYLDRADEAPADPTADNVAFKYTGGVGDDAFNIVMSVDNTFARGDVTREDWNLTVDGGAGDDAITLRMDGNGINNVSGSSVTYNNWYLNQKLLQNVAVIGGEGNDTVRTLGSGDYHINLGAGNDTAYLDNTGDRAFWAFNTLGNFARTDLRSDDNDSYNLYKTKVEVSFHGFEVVVDLNSVNGKATDLDINQAIKLAINNDPVLSKLLLAGDGPANTLTVQALIDGAHQRGDLEITLVPPTVLQLTDGDVSQLNALYGTAHDKAGWVAYLQAQADIFNGNLDANGDAVYNTQYWDGTNSAHVQDSVVEGGVGNDVLVLGTGQFSNDTIVYKGFDNGTDSIVHFDVGTPVTTTNIVPVPGALETFTVTFSDIAIAVPTDPTTLDFDGVTVTLDDTLIQASLIPGVDVAWAFVSAYNGAPGTHWTASIIPGTNQVEFAHIGNGDVTNVTSADFVYNANATGTTALTNYVNGVDDYFAATPGTAQTFTVDFAGTVVNNGTNADFTFDTVLINTATGDGPIALAAKVAAGAYPNWTAVDNLDGTVSFTANAVGLGTSINASDFQSLTIDGVAAAVSNTSLGTDPTAQTGTATTVTTVTNGEGMDYIDFSAYGSVGVFVDYSVTGSAYTDLSVNGVTATGTATIGQKFITMTESATNAGEFTAVLWQENGVTDTKVGTIGVLDFGWDANHLPDFVADNFILA